MDERRKSRTQVSLVARYRSPTVFEFVDEECFDLSEGGMFISSKAPAPAGTLLKIECQIADSADVIAAVARVVWMREEESAEGPRGMGVKFVKLENNSSDVISAFLARASHSIPPGRASTLPSTPPASARASSVAAVPVAAVPVTTQPEAQTQSLPPAQTKPEPTPAEPEKARVPTPSAEPVKKGKKSKKAKKADAKKAAQAPAAAKTETKPAADKPAETKLSETKSATPTSATTKANDAPKVVTPSAGPVATAPSQGGIPAMVWLVGGAILIAFVVFATRDKAPDPAPVETPATVNAPPAAREIAPTPATPAAATEPPANAQLPIEEPPANAPVVEAPADAPVVEAAAAEPSPPVAGPTPMAAEPTRPAPASPTATTYAVSVVTTPKGAVVEAVGQRCVAPCTLRIGGLDNPVRFDASKANYQATAATITDEEGFVERDGVMHKTLYLKLHPDPAAAPTPAAREPVNAPQPAAEAPKAAPQEAPAAAAESP